MLEVAGSSSAATTTDVLDPLFLIDLFAKNFKHAFDRFPL